jgi:hypothetical protein
MTVPTSPSSTCSELEPPKFVADPKIVRMLVQILISRHSVLHYHGQTQELAMYQWWVSWSYGKVPYADALTQPIGQLTIRGKKSTHHNLMLTAISVHFATPVAFAPGVVAMSRVQSFWTLEDQIKGNMLLNAQPIPAATCVSCLIPYTEWWMTDISYSKYRKILWESLRTSHVLSLERGLPITNRLIDVATPHTLVCNPEFEI